MVRMKRLKNKILKIEITFPIPVEIKDDGKALFKAIQKICDDNEPRGNALWASSYGHRKIELASEDELFFIECSTREKREGEG